MITTASVHLDHDECSPQMRCSVRNDNAGSITISDGQGGEVVLYVNADTAAQLAAAALEVMNAIDVRRQLANSICGICGAASADGRVLVKGARCAAVCADRSVCEATLDDMDGGSR